MNRYSLHEGHVVIFRSWRRHTTCGPALSSPGRGPTGEPALRPLSAAALVMATVADSPRVLCPGPVPAIRRRPGGRPQSKGVTDGLQPGSGPAVAQPTCSYMCHPQAPCPPRIVLGMLAHGVRAACGRGRFMSVCRPALRCAFCQRRGAWCLAFPCPRSCPLHFVPEGVLQMPSGC